MVKKSFVFLRKKQMGELVRDLGLEGQKQKEGTPTMGGLIIILATLVPVILFTKFNIYILLLLITMLWMGAIGFIDDYLKKIKKNKKSNKLTLIIITVFSSFLNNLKQLSIKKIVANNKYKNSKKLNSSK